jgi:hypothetical protein
MGASRPRNLNDETAGRTLAEGVGMLCEWLDRFQDSYPKGIAASELKEAVSTIETLAEVPDKDIVSVHVLDSRHVCIVTGFIGGPLYGGGKELLLARSESGNWEIEDWGDWIS